MGKKKASKNYGIMADNVNAGAIAIGDHSSAKNTNKEIRTEQLLSAIDTVRENISTEDSKQLNEKILQLKHDIENGDVKAKKAEGVLVKIVEGLSNSETIVKKISSVVGAASSIIALF
jgi:anti-sigma28 factor (negative regulator of flagellin synthesis)